jgi:hypothetical protein
MTIALRTTNHGQKGGTLISVIGVILIVGVLGVSAISLIQSSEHSSLSANAGSRAYYLAESGLRYAQQRYCDEGWPHGREKTLSLLGGGDVKIIRIADTFWATAETGLGTAQEARDRILMPLSLCGVDPDAAPADEFAIFGEVGALALGNKAIIQGNVAIIGEDVTIKGEVVGDVLAIGDIEMTTSNSTVTGDVYSGGLVNVKTGSVTGYIHSANGIIIGSAQSAVVGGWLFSNGSIEVGGGGQVGGHIYSCGGNVSLSGSADVGTAANPIEIRATGNVTISGSAVVYGIVYAGGSIEVGGTINGAAYAEGSIVVGGTINGDAYARGTIINSGVITGEALQNSPVYVEAPICPDLSNLVDLELPDATEFFAGGPPVSVSAGTAEEPIHYLAPGTYGALSTSNSASLSLNAGSAGHGNYYFDSVSLGSNMTLYLDLSGAYDIRIFVVGNIDISNNVNVLVSTDGTTYNPMKDHPLLAARVYWESHGYYALGTESEWFGSVYTPSGFLSAENDTYLIGSYSSGGGQDLSKSTVIYVAPNYFSAGP